MSINKYVVEDNLDNGKIPRQQSKYDNNYFESGVQSDVDKVNDLTEYKLNLEDTIPHL